ncbi:zinc finger protein [Oryctes borbonicus]|uniref:RING-type E3 ubiquitin transferase n=1 Tax=Oryctes borbonicus TaxID=1629725 RepID=A0A0T6AV93_9SCAR|nr:zinc finger protein [Oryctes borbonicus]
MANYFEEMSWQIHFVEIARLLRGETLFTEAEGDQKPAPPASRKVVNELPEETIDVEGKQCPVCLEMHEIGEIVKKLPCKHRFHSACITSWLEKTNSCPICRYELPTDDEEYEEYRREKIRAKQREKEIASLHNSMYT